MAAHRGSPRTWLQALVRRAELASGRFGRMLRHRQITVADYQSAFPPEQLRRQLRNCRRCPSHQRCERVLASVELRHSYYAFCPNRAEIERFIAQWPHGMGGKSC